MAKVISAEASDGGGSVGPVDRRPALAIGFGRGSSGKSTLLSELAWRAMNAGRDIVVADFDPRSKTLVDLFPTAVVPVSEELPDVKSEFMKLLNRMTKEKASSVVDFGGGDRFMLEFGRDLMLVEYCARKKIDPVAIYVLGPEIEDLRHCLSIFDAGYFLPERMLIVFNEGAIREGKTVKGAFTETMADEGLKRMLASGAKAIMMNKLPCMELVKRKGLNFYSASTGDCREPLDPVEEFMVESWLADLEAKRIKVGVSDWLP
jgi:hypothetical protein